MSNPTESSMTHCQDCCCARSWKALCITEYTGLSIPEHIGRLVAIAVAARALVQTGHADMSANDARVDETALTTLESALAAAGYDMTDEEFRAAVVEELERRVYEEPSEIDGEAFRGDAAVRYLEEQQAAARKLK